MFKKITHLSEKLTDKRNILKKELSDHDSLSSFKITFPSYPFNENNNLIQAMPWGHNGFLLEFGKSKIIVDPGYDFLARCIKDNLPIYSYNTLLLSHAHIDHYASAGVMIEVMSIQKSKKITVLAPKKVFQDKVISAYFSNLDGMGKNNVTSITMQNKRAYFQDDLEIYPVKLFHSINDTLGFIFRYQGKKIGYLSDTGYTKEFVTTKGVYKTGEKYEGEIVGIRSKHSYIKKAFSGVNILIVNVNDFIYNRHSKYHLSGIDLIDILDRSNIQECYVTHINAVSSIHKEFLTELKAVILEKTGISIHTIGKDGLELSLCTS